MKSGWQKERSWRCPRIQKLSKVSCIGPTLFGSFTIACHVVTRVRGEQGGTTGVLDRGIGENRERERERDAHTHTDKEAHGNAARQHRRHELSRRQSTRTLVYVYKYMYADDSNGYNRSGRRDGCRRLITYTHRGARWGICRKHTGVPRSRISLWRTYAKKAMENNRDEEFGHSPTTLRSN